MNGYSFDQPPDVPAEPIPATGSHVGTVGVRGEFTIRVLKVVSLGVGEWGERFVCVMETPDGHRVVWFTGENLALNEGESHTITARVVKQDEYNGRRQTVVQRVKVKG